MESRSRALACTPTRAPCLDFTTLDRDVQEIRVAKLLPGRWNDPICCTLSMYSLLQFCPPYEALSYVWEAEPGYRQISLDGKPHLATTNLFLALRRLRREEEVLSIWVDALCINQGDLEEKSHQVALMGEIYRRCSRVYCWLGEYKSDPSSVRAKMTIEEATRIGFPWDVPPPDESAFKEIFDDGFEAFGFISQLSRGAHLSELKFSMSYAYGETTFEHYVGLKSVRKLFESPWWSRIWVVQETILPPQALMVYGSVSAPWQMFLRASRAIQTHTRGCCSSTLNLMYERHRFLIRRIRALVHELEASRQDLMKQISSPFRELLYRYRGRKASDGRDMVYALTGLATDIEPELGFKPDYTLSKQEVYKKITLFSLRTERKLYILETHRSPKPDMPSWIYDWSDPLDRKGWGSWLSERARLTESRGFYNASLDTMYSASENNTPLLFVSGVYVDQVALVGDCCTMGDDGTDWRDILIGWRIMTEDWFREKISPDSPRKTTWEDLFWRTVMGDITFNPLDGSGERTSAEDRKSFDIWWSKFLGPERANTWSEPESLMNSYYYGCVTYSISAAILGRSYFLTKSGYMGLGNPEVGDQVWILCGGDIPFILRTSPDGVYNYLIGGCYVQGIMDGEAMEDYTEKKQTVVLH